MSVILTEKRYSRIIIMQIRHDKNPLPPGLSPGRGQDMIVTDIETTGLSKDNTILYMIGCCYTDNQQLCTVQWFNDDGVSEREILMSFHAFLSDKKGEILTFNGDRFDLPYLSHHSDFHKVESDLDSHRSIDLYRILKPYQSALGLKKGRQKD